jgi:hypothetical protein
MSCTKSVGVNPARTSRIGSALSNRSSDESGKRGHILGHLRFCRKLEELPWIAHDVWFWNKLLNAS